MFMLYLSLLYEFVKMYYKIKMLIQSMVAYTFETFIKQFLPAFINDETQYTKNI